MYCNQKVYKDDFEEGKQMVEKNKAWGMVYFQQNFSSVFLDRIDNILGDMPDDLIEMSTIHLYIDMTDRIVESYLKAVLTDKYFYFMQKLYRDCGWNDQVPKIPIRINDPIHGSNRSEFTQHQIPIFIMCISFFLPLLLTPAFLLHEKLNGFLQRCMFSGLTTTELILALVSMESIVLFIQTLSMFIILYFMYYMPVVGNVWLSFSILFFQGLCGIFLGVLISLLSDSYFAALMGGNCITFLVTCITGIVWPLEGAHPFLLELAQWSPLGQSPEAFRSLISRGWTLQHKKVYSGYISIFIWSIIFVVLIYITLKKKQLVVRK